MLRLHPGQMAALDDAAKASFRGRVAAYLRRNLPEHTRGLTDVELDTRIQIWQARAARYGVTTERGIAKWCFLSMATTETFDETPAINEYLRGPGPDPASKVDALMDALYIRKRQAEMEAKK
jgi:hypothetical protein